MFGDHAFNLMDVLEPLVVVLEIDETILDVTIPFQGNCIARQLMHFVTG